MFLIGLGTAVPPNRYTQRECFDALQTAPFLSTLQPRSRALLRKVLLGANGITARYLALNPLAEGLDLNPNTLHVRFSRHAPTLATQAAERALTDAGCAARDIDALVISTCTGYVCPGLTSYVAERLALPADVFTLGPGGAGLRCRGTQLARDRGRAGEWASQARLVRLRGSVQRGRLLR